MTQANMTMRERKKLSREVLVNWAASVIAYREYFGIGGDVTFAFACDARKARIKANKIIKELRAEAQRDAAKEAGYCGEKAPSFDDRCILPTGHPGPHQNFSGKYAWVSAGGAGER